MKIRLKVSVKARGGRTYIPGMYDTKDHPELAASLEGEEREFVFEKLPNLVEAPEEEIFEEEETEEETEETEELEEEQPVKKKKKKKKV